MAKMTNRRTQLLSRALLVLMCGDMALYVPAIAQGTETHIVIKDFMFSPTTLVVKAGSTVTWTNRDEEPHTVVGAAGLFKSGGLDTNDSFSYKFTEPGKYTFVCTVHPQMVGTIVVQ
jgi:plastocyanin